MKKVSGIPFDGLIAVLLGKYKMIKPLEQSRPAILFLCPEFPPENYGGIGTFYYEFVQYCAQRNDFDIHVVVFSKHLPISGVRFHLLSKSPGFLGKLLHRLRVINEVRMLVKRFNIAIVELPEYGGWLPFPLFSKSRVIVRLHTANKILSVLRGQRNISLVNIFEYLTLSFHRNWIAVSPSILEKTRTAFGLNEAKSCVILNGVSLPSTFSEPNSTTSGPYFAFLGSLSILKGIDLAAKAFSIIAASHPEVQLVFIGKVIKNENFDSKDYILSFIPSEYHSRVKFLGLISKPEAMVVLQRSLCLVFPSRFESSGLSVYEAMLVGKLAIIPSQEPFLSLLKDQQANLFFKPGDYSDLSLRMSEVLNQSHSVHEIEVRARQFVERCLNIDSCYKKSVLFYFPKMGVKAPPIDL